MENSSRDGNIRPPYLPPEKPVCGSRNTLEPDVEQWTDSKLGKEYIKTVYCNCLFNLPAEYIIQNGRLDESQAGIKISGKNIDNIIYADDTTLWQKAKDQRAS